jgi:hypothetical protein
MPMLQRPDGEIDCEAYGQGYKTLQSHAKAA